MVLDPIPQPLPVHFFGSRPQPPTSHTYVSEVLCKVMCVCVWISMIYVCMWGRVKMCMYACEVVCCVSSVCMWSIVQMCEYECGFGIVHARILTHMQTHTYNTHEKSVCTHVHVCKYTCIYICVYIHIHIYIYIYMFTLLSRALLSCCRARVSINRALLSIHRLFCQFIGLFCQCIGLFNQFIKLVY